MIKSEIIQRVRDVGVIPVVRASSADEAIRVVEAIKAGGVSVDNHFWQVWTLRDGKVIRSTHHWEKAEALEAAGLSE